MIIMPVSFKRISIFWQVLPVLILVTSGTLIWRRNRALKEVNRSLIIQQDSIKSVQLNLERVLLMDYPSALLRKDSSEENTFSVSSSAVKNETSPPKKAAKQDRSQSDAKQWSDRSTAASASSLIN